MKTLALVSMLILALAVEPADAAQATGETNAVPLPESATARDYFNAGTKLLAATNFVEAEKMFESALAAQDDRVQPQAIYNLGHARFADGQDRLDRGPDAEKATGKGQTALAAGAQALHQAESALADNDLNKMIHAYLEGRGARRNLREAEKAVSAAMETYGRTLELWQRSADDFKGAAELNPADTNAAKNAEIIARDIARLVDSLRKMREVMGLMGQQKQDLGKVLSKLKGQIPAADAPPGGGGEDDEDDNKGVTPESLAGKKENPGREGEQMPLPLSPDQASQILNGISLDGTRRLEMSDKQGAPSKDRTGKNW